MNDRILKDLEKAKALYADLNLAEAYPIFKRLYDRLPFKYVPEHSQYFGMFARTLYELGRENELKFYASEFEKLYEKTGDLEVAYQLAYIYSDKNSLLFKRAKEIFEKIIRDSANVELKIKSKMCLASLFETHSEDPDLIKPLILSIDEPENNSLRIIWLSWKAIILRNEKKYGEAVSSLNRVLESEAAREEKYAYFTTLVVLASVYLEMKEMERALDLIQELKTFVKDNPLKMLLRQINSLEERLNKANSNSTVTFCFSDRTEMLGFGSRSYALKKKTASEKLLRQLLTNRTLDKSMIMKTLYDRSYEGEADDKLIYYHVFGVRALLKKIGVTENIVKSVNGGYQLSPEVVIKNEEIPYEVDNI